MALEKEMETYKAKLPELLQYAGRYVVISGDDVLGQFETYEAAITHAYDKCGLDRRFMVKRITPHEQVHVITRLLVPACR